MRNNDGGKMREKGIDQAEQGEQEEKAENDDKVKVKVRVKKKFCVFICSVPYPIRQMSSQSIEQCVGSRRPRMIT